MNRACRFCGRPLPDKFARVVGTLVPRVIVGIGAFEVNMYVVCEGCAVDFERRINEVDKNELRGIS